VSGYLLKFDTAMFENTLKLVNSKLGDPNLEEEERVSSLI
jgi:hypothetical protein